MKTKDKNENEWVYKLKETHVKKVDALNDKYITLQSELEYQTLLNAELMHEVTRLRKELKDELYFNGKNDIDREILTHDFMQNVS